MRLMREEMGFRERGDHNGTAGSWLRTLFATTAMAGLCAAGSATANNWQNGNNWQDGQRERHASAPAELHRGNPQLAQSTQQRDFEIPPQTLSSALTQFGRQSGLQVAVDSTLISGLATQGIEGEYTPEEALRRLLAGTGLNYRFTGADTITLAKAGAQDGDGPIELGPIKVEGWRTTEVEGYRPQVISSATKTDELIADIPASVSVVTEDVIEDQNAQSVQEALRNVPGVTFGPNAANVSVQEEVSIRGFESALVNVNGVERRSTGPLSLANVESVEVLKGPFSVLYGDLSPGGFVNIQTKRPQPVFGAEAVAGFNQVLPGRGTEGNGSIDITGPIDEEGMFLYRFIASADGGTSFIDEVDQEQYFVAPSLAFIGLSGDLRVDIDASYLRNDETFRYGIPSRNGRPDTRLDFDTFLGAADNEKLTEDWTAEIRADYQITEATTVDAAFSWHLNEHFSYALRPFGEGQTVAPNDTVKRSLSLRSFDTTDLQFEANAIHELTYGPTDWRFVVGGDVRRTKIEDAGPGRGNIVNFDTINVFDPEVSVRLPPLDDPRISFFDFSEQTTDTFGVYMQVETWVYDRVKLLAGARYTTLTYEFEDASGFGFEENPDSIDPRFGVLYKATPSTSAYASYSTSFEQSFSFDPEITEPLEAEQIEVGIKQEFFGGRALATIAGFQLTQKNRIEGTGVPGVFEQIGKARTRGVEVEVSGEVIEGLNVIGGYAFLDNEITEAEDDTLGNELPNVAKHSASLWMTYDVIASVAERLTLGGGIFFKGDRFTSSANNSVLPSYVTADVMAQYEFGVGEQRLRARAGIKNLFDEEVFVSGFGRGLALRGEPRTFTAELGITF